SVNGAVSANGLQSSYYSGGAGAGGSVWIDSGNLNGTGTITANGGAAYNNQYASGGGGRVAVFCNASSFSDGNIRAYTGAANANSNGGAGTVYYRPTSSGRTTLIIDNGGQASRTISQIVGDVTVPQDLLVRNAGQLGPATGDTTMHLTVQGDATVASDGA